MSFTSDLMMLANTGGGYRKQGALKSIWPDENIQWFFYQAMSPYIHFNMTMKMNDIIGEGDKEDPEEALIMLIDRVQSGDLRGTIAKRELKKELSKYTVDFQRLIHRMINKELRMGVGPAVVNKVAPGFLPEFMVPLAHRVEWRKVAYPCLVSPKVDGLRCIYQDGQLLSRKGKPIQGLTWLAKRLATCIPTNLKRLDGEIVAPGANFDEISGKLRSFNETPDAHYYLFDMVLENQGLPLYKRQTLLTSWTASITPAEGHLGFSALPNTTCHTEDQVLEKFDEALREGFEGVMVKGDCSPYYDGRTYYWQKVKKSDSIDLRVVGWEPGEGKYQDMVGALKCELPNGQISYVGSGLKDDQRAKWAEDPTLILGKYVEVEFMEQSSKGVLRHPRLKCVRGDK